MLARSRAALLAAVLCSGCARCAGSRGFVDADATDVGISIDAADVASIDVAHALDQTAADEGGVQLGELCELGQCCRATPTPVVLTVDASCGDGCVVVPTPVASVLQSWLFGERRGEVEYGSQTSYVRSDLHSGVTVDPWRWSAPSYCGRNGAFGLMTAGFVGAQETTYVCQTGAGFELRSVDRVMGQECLLFQTTIGGGAANLRRVTGAWAWLGSDADSSSLAFLHILPDGSADARVVRGGPGDHISLAGGGDTLVFVQRSNTESLSISRAPFTEAHTVWDSGGTIGPLASDPENPNHVVFDHSPSGDDLCGAGANIYYFDLTTAETIPPRPLTTGSITHVVPQIRGDRVAYIDYADDTLNPGGCLAQPHNAQAIVTTSLANGGRTVVRPGGSGLIWLGRDRLWMPWGQNTAYQMLPPQ